MLVVIEVDSLLQAMQSKEELPDGGVVRINQRFCAAVGSLDVVVRTVVSVLEATMHIPQCWLESRMLEAVREPSSTLAHLLQRS